jgi:hypothetical protein
MPRLRIFEETGVIFADIGSGRDQMLDMHDSLATGPLEFVEPWDYYPHITLVQGIPPEQVIPAYQRTLEIWNSLPFGKSFHVDTLTFVQATLENCWLDLAELELRGAVQLSTR